MSIYLPSLFGGMLLGVAAMILLLLNGRIAGISGIFGRLIGGESIGPNLAFVMGLVAGPLAYRAVFGAFPQMTMMVGWPVAMLAGVIVGIGTRMGSGCTSGHGILGMARFSKRSIVATMTFLIMGIITATLTGGLK